MYITIHSSSSRGRGPHKGDQGVVCGVKGKPGEGVAPEVNNCDETSGLASSQDHADFPIHTISTSDQKIGVGKKGPR